MKWRSQVDDSQRQLVPFLRAHGASFQSLATVGKGAPDGIVGFHGVDVLCEFKTGAERLSASQVVWHREWRGAKVRVLRTEADCLLLLDYLRKAGGLLRGAA